MLASAPASPPGARAHMHTGTRTHPSTHVYYTLTRERRCVSSLSGLQRACFSLLLARATTADKRVSERTKRERAHEPCHYCIRATLSLSFRVRSKRESERDGESYLYTERVYGARSLARSLTRSRYIKNGYTYVHTYTCARCVYNVLSLSLSLPRECCLLTCLTAYNTYLPTSLDALWLHSRVHFLYTYAKPLLTLQYATCQPASGRAAAGSSIYIHTQSLVNLSLSFPLRLLL